MPLVTNFFCLLLFFSKAYGNIVGSDAQSFNATTNGIDFVTVQSSDILEVGVANFGVFLNYAVNSLPFIGDDDNQQWSLRPRDRIGTADLNVGYGLTTRLDLGLSVPSIIYQKIDDSNGTIRGQFVQNGVTEIRGNTKFRVVGDHTGGFSFVGTLNYNLLQDNPYLGQNSNWVYSIEGVAHKVFGPITAALNLGYRLRNSGPTIPGAPIEPLKNQYLASTAASYNFEKIHTKFITEIFSAFPVQKTDTGSNRLNSSLEGLVGLKNDVNDALALHFGMGGGLQHGLASPDYRIYAGLNYVLGGKKEVILKKTTVEEQAQPTDEDNNPLMAIPHKGDQTVVLHNINFAFDRFDLVLPGTKKTLEQLAAYILKPPVFQKLVISGHTDGFGGEEYNQKLSESRAAQIKKYLVALHKIDPSKIEIFGYGLSKPVASNGNYQGRRLNRRVEFTIHR